MKTIFNSVLIVRFFFIGNLAFAYSDSAVYISKFYGLSLSGCGIAFLLLSYYVIMYFKKTKNLVIEDSHIKSSYLFLKIAAFLIAIAPLVVTPIGKVVSLEVHIHELPKTFFELLKILGVEVVLDFSIWAEKKLKEKKS